MIQDIGSIIIHIDILSGDIISDKKVQFREFASKPTELRADSFLENFLSAIEAIVKPFIQISFILFFPFLTHLTY